MTHTPGPWRVEQFGHGWDYEIRCDARTDRIATIAYWPDGVNTDDSAEANAHLIAAAPDLLIACKVALNDPMYREWPPIAELLAAAIAKAEGR